MVLWELILDWYHSALGLFERIPAWQQNFVTIAAIVLIGILISFPLINLFTRPHKQPSRSGQLNDWKVLSPKTGSITADPLEDLMKKRNELNHSYSVKAGSSERLEGQPRELEQKIKIAAPAMLQEIRTNLFNATKPWDGLVVPFQTEVWYKEPDSLRSLPVNLQNELSEAYIDIGLANDIYWLLNKLNHRNPELDKAYLSLRLKIATRLGRIVSIKEPVKEPVKALTR